MKNMWKNNEEMTSFTQNYRLTMHNTTAITTGFAKFGDLKIPIGIPSRMIRVILGIYVCSYWEKRSNELVWDKDMSQPGLCNILINMAII